MIRIRLAPVLFAGSLMLGTLMLGACSRRSDSIDPALQGEASLLIQAVERLRQSVNSEKHTQLSALLALPCTQADTCALKDRCVDAYRGFVEALDDIAKIESALTNATSFTAADLANAQRSLDVAREKTLNCSNAQGELARRLSH
jgi:hypothetical protein